MPGAAGETDSIVVSKRILNYGKRLGLAELLIYKASMDYTGQMNAFNTDSAQ